MDLLDEELNIYDLELGDPMTVDIPLTFVINDFRNLETRNGTFSKTIKIPSTKVNDSLLSQSFDITAEGFFDRNTKSRFRMERFGVLLMKGYMQLKECIMENGYLKEYELALFSDNSSFFYNIQDKSLRELSFGTHEYSADNIEASWENDGDDEYVYPMVDLGYLENIANNTSIPVNAWVPALFIKKILKKIISEAGYSLESNFFNKKEFKNLILYNPKDFQLSQEQIDALSFKVGMNSDMFRSADSYTPNSINSKIEFDNESTPFFDNGADFNQTIYRYVVDDGWAGDMVVQVQGLATFKPYFATSNWTIQTKPTWTVELRKNGSVVKSMGLNTNATGTQLTSSYTETLTFNLNYENQTFASGDIFEVYLKIDPTNGSIVNSIGQSINFYAQFNVDSDADVTYWYNNVSNEILEFSTIHLNNILPNWKQSDFLKALCQNFNLIISSNEITKQIRIETRNDFYYDIFDYENWKDKQDILLEERLVQIEEGLSRVLKFDYKEDENDNLVQNFESDKGVNYSNKEKELDNEFLTGEMNVADLPYAATVMGLVLKSTTATQLYVPRLINNDAIQEDIDDGGIGQSFDFEPRIFIYDGLVTPSNTTGYSLFRISGGSLNNQSYPFAYFVKQSSGIHDISLSFVNYKNIAGTGYANDKGLYDRFYADQIRQINFGRLYIAYFKLSETDILNLNFRKPKLLQINGNKTYFHLNKINDYLAGQDESTEVELIQIPFGYGDNTE